MVTSKNILYLLNILHCTGSLYKLCEIHEYCIEILLPYMGSIGQGKTLANEHNLNQLEHIILTNELDVAT